MIEQINQLMAKAFRLGLGIGFILGAVFVLVAVLAGQMF
jgi:Mg/Co/Ni transporter MgtE